MSGYYSNWVKVNKPDEILPQMASPSVPFFFGGSQVPETLKIQEHKILGRGLLKSSLHSDFNNPKGNNQRNLYESENNNYYNNKRIKVSRR